MSQNVLCMDTELIEVELDKAEEAICYPRIYAYACSDRMAKLRYLGIEKIFSFGKQRISNINIVGKGHAAVVVLAKHRDYGVVAVKIRRFDSKRISIAKEGELLRKAITSGVVPKVYLFDDDFIIREYIDGITLKEFLINNMDNRPAILSVFSSLLEAAFKLDIVGIELEEITIPLTQVVLRCGDPTKPYFIDFESARESKNARNVTSIVGFIVGRSFAGKRIRDVLGLGEGDVRKLVELARKYKGVAIPEERRRLVDEMKELISKNF